MLGKQQFRLLCGLGCAALLLAGIDIGLVVTNRAAQNEYNARAQYIQQGLQLEPVYQNLIRTLAELSVRQNDAQLRGLLSAQGISFSVANPEAKSVEKSDAPAGAKPGVNPEAQAETKSNGKSGWKAEGGRK